MLGVQRWFAQILETHRGFLAAYCHVPHECLVNASRHSLITASPFPFPKDHRDVRRIPSGFFLVSFSHHCFASCSVKIGAIPELRGRLNDIWAKSPQPLLADSTISSPCLPSLPQDQRSAPTVTQSKTPLGNLYTVQTLTLPHARCWSSATLHTTAAVELEPTCPTCPT